MQALLKDRGLDLLVVCPICRLEDKVHSACYITLSESEVDLEDDGEPALRGG